MEHIFLTFPCQWAFQISPRGGAITLDVIVEELGKKIKNYFCNDSGFPGIPRRSLEKIIFSIVLSGPESGRQK